VLVFAVGGAVFGAVGASALWRHKQEQERRHRTNCTSRMTWALTIRMCLSWQTADGMLGGRRYGRRQTV
jgi:hypothetical protein